MTFSVVFYDRDSESWGVGVASKFIAVGSVVPWAEAGTGAIATQAFANYSYGPNGLKHLREKNASDTLNALISADDKSDIRQIGVVDRDGNVAAHTGSKCHDFAGHITGDGFTVQGNLLARREVIESMAKEMERKGPIMERVMRTLEAAQSNGGDRRGKQSASILITTKRTPFEEYSDRSVDLRVDDSEEPLEEIRRMSLLWDATFFDQEMVEVSEYAEKIKSALSSTNYETLEEWAGNNNFSSKISGTKIGAKALEALLSGARRTW